jgi:predicted ATPase/DNA-binding winged helix-turn-helix (wHTH) protein
METYTLNGESPDTVYLFGAFELLVRQQLLVSAGTPVKIGTRAIAILVQLVKRAGELVSNEELVAAAWPSTFVHRANLKVNVANLRRALASRDPQQDYIANVPGRGYRFIVAVRAKVAEAATFSSSLRCETLPPPISLVGRADEVATVCDSVLDRRFVTIVGAGGVGKTSIAIAAAHRLSDRFADGVCFVDLSSVGDPEFLASAIVAGLGARSDSEDLLGAAIQTLKGQTKLLLLDNCEHLLPGLAAAAERLRKNLPNTSVLVTSREPLRLPCEKQIHLDPLAVPATDAALADTAQALMFPAVELFAMRAGQASDYRLTQSDVSIVAAICRRLDGIPLAIELAASRTVTYAPAELLGLLQERFDSLDRSSDESPARHRALRATLDWSYDLLASSDAATLRALSAYAGAFTVDDAIVVASAADVPAAAALEGTANLISKSLLSTDSRYDAPHFRLLDSTRAFVAEKLQKDPNCNRILQRHAERICSSLERIQTDRENVGTTEAHASDNFRWVADARRALGWAFGGKGSIALGIRLTVAAIPMWENFSLVDESISYLSYALSEGRRTAFDDAGAEVRLQLALASAIMYAGGLAPEADRAWDLALALAEQREEPECQLRALWGRAAYDLHSGRPAASARLLGVFANLCHTLSDQSAAPDGERLLCAAEMYLGNLRGAKARAQRLLELYLKSGKRLRHARYQINRAAALGTTLAMLSWLMGDADAAAVAEDTARDALASGHAVSLCNVLSLTACPIALWDGRLDDAERYLALLQEHLKGARLKLWAQLARCLEGAVLTQRSDEAGIRLLEPAIEDLLATGSAIRAPVFKGMLAEAQARLGRIDDATRTIEDALACEAEQGERWCLPELLRIEAAICLRQGQAHRAEKLLLGAIELANEIGAKAWFLRAQNDLASLRQGRRLPRGPLDRRRNSAAKQHRDENSRPVQYFAGKS